MTRSRDKRRKAVNMKQEIKLVQEAVFKKRGVTLTDKQAKALINGVMENGI